MKIENMLVRYNYYRFLAIIIKAKVITPLKASWKLLYQHACSMYVHTLGRTRTMYVHTPHYCKNLTCFSSLLTESFDTSFFFFKLLMAFCLDFLTPILHFSAAALATFTKLSRSSFVILKEEVSRMDR